MKLRFIVVGRDRNDPLVQVSNDYLQRLQHYLPTELVEVKEESRSKNAPDARVKLKEAERIRQALEPSDTVIVLDEHGKHHTSVKLAKKFDGWMQDGLSRVSFVIGGPSGLDPDLIKHAQERWALSTFTLPHRLARVVLFEQVYRAFTIVRGEPYHR